MAFVGILSDNKSFENIREYVKNKDELNLNLIHINKKSIENIKNIKLETIVIDGEISNFEYAKEVLKVLFENAKYIVINTDINLKYDYELNKILKNNKNIDDLEANTAKPKIITYGLNRKATVTASSITDSGMLIYLQKNVRNIQGNIIEVSEKLFKTGESNKLKYYEIFIIYIIEMIYCASANKADN